MIRHTWPRRAKALALIAAMYLTGLVVYWAVGAAGDVTTAQHGPVRPAPTPTEEFSQ